MYVWFQKSILDSHCVKETNLCHLKPCKNNAICSDVSPGVYQCTCLDKWTGINCTECESENGLNNGKCGMKLYMAFSHFYYS